MALVKLSLNRLSRLEKVALGNHIHAQMTGNGNYTQPAPALTVLATNTAALQTGLETQEAADTAARQATEALITLEAALDKTITDLGDYVQNASGGDANKILSAGMEVRSAGAPVAMTQVLNLQATAGDDAGEADLIWEPVAGASSYESQVSPDPVTATSWRHAAISTKSKVSIPGLPAGDLCFFRTRAIGANGAGPWSDVAMKRIP